ncbi:hypothetical protein BH09BAC1_BH09BAC1_03540 [soil metagenome]
MFKWRNRRQAFLKLSLPQGLKPVAIDIYRVSIYSAYIIDFVYTALLSIASIFKWRHIGHVNFYVWDAKGVGLEHLSQLPFRQLCFKVVQCFFGSRTAGLYGFFGLIKLEHGTYLSAYGYYNIGVVLFEAEFYNAVFH